MSEHEFSNDYLIVVSQSNKKNSSKKEDIELEEMDKAAVIHDTHSGNNNNKLLHFVKNCGNNCLFNTTRV